MSEPTILEQRHDKSGRLLDVEPPPQEHWHDDSEPKNSDSPKGSLLQRHIADLVLNRANSPGKLIEQYPERGTPVIDGLLREAEILNVVSSSKAGKSWLANDLAMSIATGSKWLGFPTREKRVLILDNELHACETAFRQEQIVGKRGYDRKKLDRNLATVNFRQPVERNGRLVIHRPTVAQVQEALEQVQPGTYGAIIYDSKYRFDAVDGDANSENQQTGFYNILDTINLRMGSCAIVVGHGTKGNQTEKDVIDMMSGSGAQGRAVNTQVAIRPHKVDGYSVLHAKGNTFAPVEPVSLAFDFPCFTVDEQLIPQLKPTRNPKQASPAEDREAINSMRETFGTEEFAAIDCIKRVVTASGSLGESRALKLAKQAVSEGQAIKTGTRSLRGGRIVDTFKFNSP